MSRDAQLDARTTAIQLTFRVWPRSASQSFWKWYAAFSLGCFTVEMLAALPVTHEFMQQNRDVLRVICAPGSDQRDYEGFGIVKTAVRATDHGRNLARLFYVLRVNKHNRRCHVRRRKVRRSVYPMMKFFDQARINVGCLRAGRDSAGKKKLCGHGDRGAKA